MIGIYKITSPSGKIYIGQSINIEKRFKTYKRLTCKEQIRLYNSFKKYGIENHIFEVLEQCTIELLNERERFYQDFYDVISKNGLNCRLISVNDKKSILSQETKDKFRICKLGVKLKEETKIKISISNKGKVFSKKHIENLKKNHTKPMSKKILDIEENKIYNSISEYCRLKNIRIGNVFNGIYRKSKKYNNLKLI